MRIFQGGVCAAAVTVAAIVAGSSTPRAQTGSLNQPRVPAHSVVIHLNQRVDLETTTVNYGLTFTSGGYTQTGIAASKLAIDAEDLAIDTTHDGNDATSIRAIVQSAGYRFATVEIEALTTAARTVSVDLAPLETVRIAGRIDPPMAGTIEISYSPDWYVTYLLRLDQPHGPGGFSFLSSSIRVAGAVVMTDGSFSADVPDFLKDPAVQRFGAPGSLSFGLRGPSGTWRNLRLTDATESGSLPVASSYSAIRLRVVSR